MNFETVAYGKCILAGEHAVLRGCPALVFPVTSCSLSSFFTSSDTDLHVEFSGKCGDDLPLVFWGVVERACQLLSISRHQLTGQWHIKNEVPVGGGLGASAAICVTVARFFYQQGWLKEEECYEFSRSLENLFHGESSGVDIAASIAQKPQRFMRGGERSDLQMSWRPHLYLSYCGQRGVTSECVNKVKALIYRDPKQGERIDRQMAEAVEMAERALLNNKEQGLTELAKSMDLARTCFENWSLINAPLAHHMEELRHKGALAVKPTGSGLGGYVLSLWAQPQPDMFRVLG